MKKVYSANILALGAIIHVEESLTLLLSLTLSLFSLARVARKENYTHESRGHRIFMII